MILSRFLLFFVMIHDVKERPQDESHPPQPRQLIAPSIRNYLPLRSPLSSGEGSIWLHRHGEISKVAFLHILIVNLTLQIKKAGMCS